MKDSFISDFSASDLQPHEKALQAQTTTPLKQEETPLEDCPLLEEVKKFCAQENITIHELVKNFQNSRSFMNTCEFAHNILTAFYEKDVMTEEINILRKEAYNFLMQAFKKFQKINDDNQNQK